MQVSREEVYRAIDSERAYQEKRWVGHQHSNTEFLVYIRDYIEEALHRETREASATVDELTRHSLRKIAALAVAAMEQNGVETRLP